MRYMNGPQTERVRVENSLNDKMQLLYASECEMCWDEVDDFAAMLGDIDLDEFVSVLPLVSPKFEGKSRSQILAALNLFRTFTEVEKTIERPPPVERHSTGADCYVPEVRESIDSVRGLS